MDKVFGRFLMWLAAFLIIETASLAQAPVAIKYDPEILLEAINLDPGFGLRVGSDGCAYIGEIALDSPPAVIREKRSWSGACVNGLADGLGHFSDQKPTVKEYPSSLNMGVHSYFGRDGKPDGMFVQFYEMSRTSYFVADTAIAKEHYGIWDEYHKDIGFVIFDNVNGKNQTLYSISKKGNSNWKYCDKFISVNPDPFLVVSPSDYQIIKKECTSALKESYWPNRSVQVVEELSYNRSNQKLETKIFPCLYYKNQNILKKADQSYCNGKWNELRAALKPRIDSMLEQSKSYQAEWDARSAMWRQSLPQKYAAVVERNAALAVQKVTAENQARELANAASRAQITKQQTAFLASANAGSSGLAIAAKAFARPADTSRVGVIVVGHGLRGPTSFKYDLDALELESGFPVQKVSGQAAPEEFAEAVKLLKDAGAETLYIVDFQRVALAQALVGFTPEKRTVIVSSTTSANPRFAQAQAELRQARSDLASAKSEYDNYQRNPGAYGSGATGAIITAAAGIGTSNRYNKAQERVEELELSLRSTAQQTTSKATANVSMGDVKVRSRMEARLAIFACSLVTEKCAEKERLISDDKTVLVPQFVFPNDPSAAVLNKLINQANTDLYEDVNKKMEFGFSGDAIGQFVDGAMVRVPLALLPKYLVYANKSFFALMDKELDSVYAGEDAINDQLMKVGEELTAANIEYYDTEDRVVAAFTAREEAKRKQKLQTLD